MPDATTESNYEICAPTWEGAMPLLVEAAINGTTVEGRQAAMSELMRCARIADKHIAEQNGGKP